MLDLSRCLTDYMVIDDKPMIINFCRDRKGNPVTIYDKFEPYFYVSMEDVEPFLKHDRVMRVEKVELKPYPPIESQIYRVVTRIPEDVADLRDTKINGKKIKTWEADILFSLRYLIDKKITTGISWDEENNKVVPKDMPTNFRSFILDIETTSKRKLDPSVDEVIVIGFHDSFTNEITIITTITRDGLELARENISDLGKVKILKASTEKDLLQKFINLVENRIPDIILTFSLFDMAFIIDRMKVLDLDYNALSRERIVQGRRKGKELTYKIHGLQIVDIQELYSFILLKESKWGSLEDIAETENLSLKRIYHEEDVFELWKKEPWKVVIRNIRDVLVTKLLIEDKHLLESLDNIRRITGSNLDDCMFRSRIADIMYLRVCKEHGIILPTKQMQKKEKYLGGVVLDIQPGIYKNIMVLDWKSLYPSIIKAFNMSYETYRAPGFHSDDIYDIDGQYCFLKSPKGWTIELLEYLEPLREEHRRRSKDDSLDQKTKSLEDALSASTKSIINALYGLYGKAGTERDKGARIYHLQIASAITYVGRTLQTEGILEIAKKHNIDIKYEDTDSIMIALKEGDDPKQIQELLSKEMRNFFESRWGSKAEFFLLDFEHIYEKVIFLTKKRYRGKTVQGKTLTKGMEIVKKNVAQISVDAQTIVTDMIFEGKDRGDILSYVKDLVSKFGSNQLEYIGIPQRLSMEVERYAVMSAHLKAFMYSTIHLKMPLEVGKRFYTIYVDPKKLDKGDSEVIWTMGPKEKKEKVTIVGWDKDSSLPEKIIKAIDWDRMLEVSLQKKLEDILMLFNIDWKRDILG